MIIIIIIVVIPHIAATEKNYITLYVIGKDATYKKY